MKKEFRAHPLMILSLMKPFLFVLILPVLKGVLEYILNQTVTGILRLEALAFAVIAVLAFFRWRSFRLICGKSSVTVEMGILIKKHSVIKIDRLSSVQSVQNPLDAVFRAVTYCINTEAGRKAQSDFKFKLSAKESAKVSKLLYGGRNPTAVKFSAVKVAMMAATTSSAVTGMIVGVPVINKAGNLLGIALSEMLFDEINNVSGEINTYFPPVVNTVTLIILLSYAVSFFYAFFKYINFSLFLEKDKLEVRSGFFVRSRTSFKKASVNDVKIEQTPLMRFFRRYALKVSVGGYGEAKKESAVIVPSGRRGEIRRQFSAYFPFLEPDAQPLRAKRDFVTKNRFLYWPGVFFIITAAAAVILALIFKDFGRLILFLTLVICAVILYAADLAMFEYRFGRLSMGSNIFARSVRGFRTCELYCPKENIGQIKIIRNIPDIPLKTCKVVISVRSESADHIKVRHLNYSDVKKSIYECYNIKV